MRNTFSIALLLLLILFSEAVQAQKQRQVPVCRATTFAAYRALPEFNYDCPEGLIESDEKLLQTPGRIAALKEITAELSSFSDAAWWQANVDELTACEIHGQAGALSSEEKEKYRDGDYLFRLFGNQTLRLILFPDPCYQTGYNGSVAFLLYRSGGRVYVTKLLDGYYSRIENSVGFDFANLNGQQIIEISTANNMTPAFTNYYFVIDPVTHHAVPRKLFKQGKTLTNEIRSAMLLGEPSELGLPRGARDMQIISRHRLLPTFRTYEEAYVDGEGNGRKLSQTVFRWNGRFYASTRR